MGVLRKRVLFRVLLGVLSTVVVLALVGALLGVWTVRRSFPQTSGEIALPGLNAEVTVLRDEYGVPHVYAGDAHDLFMAQGYVHAQDRFWEMDFRRHVTSGRTAELFGEAQVETDVYLRTMGWRHVAEQEYELLEPETRGYLDAYAAGVNAWLAENDGAAASLEYALLGVLNGGHTIEEWDPVDSLAWLKAMAWDLGGNMREETERAQLLGLGFTEEQIAELYPEYPYEEHRPITDTDELLDTAPEGDPEDARRAPELPGEAVAAVGAVYDGALALPEMLGPRSSPDLGSNSWVVGGEHTESGLPLLANDPHLGAAMPSTWHQVGLHCTELSETCPFDVAGFGFSGLPGVVIGQNESIAWGFTNLNPDVMDLFVERIEGDSYIVDGEERPLETRTETVKVAGGEDVEITVRSTHHGPLLSDTAAGADLTGIAEDPQVEGAEEGAGYAVALQWTALSPGTTADALFVMNRARDWEDFRRAASGFSVPAQNLVYADNEGNIGYQAPGTVPVRGEGDGRYPAPGWDSAYDWEEYIPFEDLPSVYNPESGFVVTANQSGVDADYPHFLTDDWDYGYRSQRINDLLEEAVAEGPVTGGDMSEIHMDSYHLGAEAIVPHLLDVEVAGVAAQGQDLLRDWDLYTEPDSAGAAFYQATWRHLLPLLFDELDPVQMTGNSRGMYVVGTLLEDPGSAWWAGEEADGRDAVLAAAMEAAAEELTELLGDDPADWRWGDLHTLTATHQSFGTSGIGVVEWLFNRGPVESSGGSAIVNATGWDDKEGYAITAVPSMRMVVDLSDRDASTWVHLTGNSGHAFHPNYDDQLEPWARGETMPFVFGEDAVRAAAVDELTLVP
ncbi:penicillin acylase family protein [Nocardiopsis changdeensis]|uniref:Penicillin acylase family protein n=1 Tax=Nocardiopsis changdeensis TaxID=2831969 RepID=A0ABX8BMM5_9ACTN|nr:MULTISPECIES: penicillin acylase family protein [Nocardiopsis]QUX23416.1 penicillin acylase family protein [Nocardiopsis changdeensis]QYX39358.1 penicillin acylase family protein [Nocardiopsis sp. MT53]